MGSLNDFFIRHGINQVLDKGSNIVIEVDKVELFLNLSAVKKGETFSLYSEDIKINNEVHVKNLKGEVFSLMWVKKDGENRYSVRATEKRTSEVKTYTLEEFDKKLGK